MCWCNLKLNFATCTTELNSLASKFALSWLHLAASWAIAILSRFLFLVLMPHSPYFSHYSLLSTRPLLSLSLCLSFAFAFGWPIRRLYFNLVFSRAIKRNASLFSFIHLSLRISISIYLKLAWCSNRRASMH